MKKRIDIKSFFIILILLSIVTGISIFNILDNKYTYRNMRDNQLTEESSELNIINKPLPQEYDSRVISSILPYDKENYSTWQIDLRSHNLSNLDLTRKKEELMNSVFNTKTIWPDMLPKGWNPNEVMELTKNPGLNIRRLHKDGITGKGINIAVIDQGLLVEHKEYKDRLRYYETMHSNSRYAQFHASAVSSLALGKTLGVAPQAELYFINCDKFIKEDNKEYVDYTLRARAIEKIIEINKTLPSNDKIRVLSLSFHWEAKDKGYNEINQEVKKAIDEGIFVISSNLFDYYDHKFYYYGLDIDTLDNRDKSKSYKVTPWESWIYKVGTDSDFVQNYKDSLNLYKPQEMLLVPIDAKTLADSTGKNDYIFMKSGGWSWVSPYIAGLYALACQVKPNITPQMFWSLALDTGTKKIIEANGNRYVGKIVNPEKLIKSLK